MFDGIPVGSRQIQKEKNSWSCLPRWKTLLLPAIGIEPTTSWLGGLLWIRVPHPRPLSHQVSQLLCGVDLLYQGLDTAPNTVANMTNSSSCDKTSVAVAKSCIDFSQTSSPDGKCDYLFPSFKFFYRGICQGIQGDGMGSLPLCVGGDFKRSFLNQ